MSTNTEDSSSGSRSGSRKWRLGPLTRELEWMEPGKSAWHMIPTEEDARYLNALESRLSAAESELARDTKRWELLFTHYRGEESCPEYDDEDEPILCWGCELRRKESELATARAKVAATDKWLKEGSCIQIWDGSVEAHVINPMTGKCKCGYVDRETARATIERLEGKAKLALELGEKELYAIWHAAASDTFEAFRAEWLKLNARKLEDALAGKE